VSELQQTALVEEDVVVELRRERLPELQGELVERHALVPQVVGTDDGRVPDGVPVPEPAALQNGHVLDGVVLREVVGRCEAVEASPDDHHVVGGLRAGIAPEKGGVLKRRLHEKPQRDGRDSTRKPV
jgi:hypothetical protein